MDIFLLAINLKYSEIWYKIESTSEFFNHSVHFFIYNLVLESKWRRKFIIPNGPNTFLNVSNLHKIYRKLPHKSK
jgi:hypothetical protein